MNINPINLLILIGAVHGITLCMLLLFSTRNPKVSNVMLALLLAFYTLPVIRVILEDIGVFHSYGLSFLSVELLYGLGPALYLYVKMITNRELIFRRYDLLHFLPVGLELVYYSSPLYHQNQFFFFSEPINAIHSIWMIEQLGAILSVITYLILSNRRLWTYSRWIKDNFSDIADKTLRWLRTPVLLYTVFFFLWFGLRGIDVVFYADSLPIKPYYLFLVFLSFSTYWIGTKGYLVTNNLVSNNNNTQQVGDWEADDEALSDIISRLEAIMETEQLYLQSDLSLSQLAERININPRLLSKAINTKTGANFYDFINSYRIKHFQELASSQTKSTSLLSLAYASGFGSKTTFNSVFKRETGLTPSQYRRAISSAQKAPN